MLESLTIDNLVLIDHCKVDFDSKLTIITGETGAGKTSLTQALALLLGERKDTSLIRKGSSKARVEALFSYASHSPLIADLESLGIETDDENCLILSREIAEENKSRCFINRQQVPLSSLQKISSKLIHIISQHSYNSMRIPSVQRDLLDQFGGYNEELQSMRRAFHEWKALEKALLDLAEERQRKERDAEHLQQKIMELSCACLKEGEEEDLFQEYTLLAQSSEKQEKLSKVLSLLSEGPRPFVKDLYTIKSQLEGLARQSKEFDEPLSMVENAMINLQELEAVLHNIFHHENDDPKRIDEIENRLSLYQKIKKKYGSTYKEWMEHLQDLKKTAHRWDSLEGEIDDLKLQFEHAQHNVEECAKALTILRKQSAKTLSLHLSGYLSELNMPSATVIISLTEEKRTELGDDAVAFFLQANKGENLSSIKDHTSGGELSRLLLSIKTALAEKNDTNTLVFDEIDANVGGTTAALMAIKLKQLSQSRQVVCITHFPQVAKYADLHLAVQKIESDQRTTATIEALHGEKKQAEIQRMLGNSLPASSTI